jgi:carboxyl-terminal processing protease
MRLVLTAAAAVAVLLASSVTAAYREGVSSARADLPPAFAALGEVYDEVTSDAVEVPPDDVLAAGAIEGLLAALGDPYAAYYDAAEFAAFNDTLDGEFSGVGLVLEEAPEGLTVVQVIEGAPAAQAGVEVGERLVAVDGRDVRDLPTDAIIDLVKGEEGTEVTLGLEGGAAGPRTVTLTRARITVPNLEARRLDDGGGYVRLLQFSEDAGSEVRAAVERLVAEGARGVVLDLRGNPGGLLREAVDVASVFVEDGTIVSVREREGRVRAHPAEGDALDVPLVVLVDQGSASASEIVAGAVQDLERGEIVGETTFGKGTVQTVEPIVGGAGVKFTTAQYLTPSGDSIEGVGVVPDRVAAGDADAQLAAAQEALRMLLAER